MIDYLSLRNKANQGVTDLLKGGYNSVPSETEAIRSSVLSRRPLTRSLQKAGINPTGYQNNRLNNSLNSALLRQKYNLSKSRGDLLFQQYMDSALQAGMDMQSAENFARQKSNLDKQYQFEAEQNQLAREQKIKESEAADKAAEQGITLENNYANDYGRSGLSGALLRLLVGTGTLVGTSYLLNRKKKSPDTPTTYDGTQFGPEYNRGYYPQPAPAGYYPQNQSTYRQYGNGRSV